MKFVLSMILCSSVSGTCLEPYRMTSQYDDLYSCLQGGYSESIIKTENIANADDHFGTFINYRLFTLGFIRLCGVGLNCVQCRKHPASHSQ